jgi:hypothetical protein
MPCCAGILNSPGWTVCAIVMDVLGSASLARLSQEAEELVVWLKAGIALNRVKRPAAKKYLEACLARWQDSAALLEIEVIFIAILLNCCKSRTIGA